MNTTARFLAVLLATTASLAACNAEIAVLDAQADASATSSSSSGGSSGDAPHDGSEPVTPIVETNASARERACAFDFHTFMTNHLPEDCQGTGCLAGARRDGNNFAVALQTDQRFPKQVVAAVSGATYFTVDVRNAEGTIIEKTELLRWTDTETDPTLIGEWAPSAYATPFNAAPTGDWIAYAVDDGLYLDGYLQGTFGESRGRILSMGPLHHYFVNTQGLHFLYGDGFGTSFESANVLDAAIDANDAQAALVLQRPSESALIVVAPLQQHQVQQGSLRELGAAESTEARVAYGDDGSLFVLDGRTLRRFPKDGGDAEVLWRGDALPQQPGMLGVHDLQVVGSKIYFEEVCEANPDMPGYAQRVLDLEARTISWRIDESNYPFVDHLTRELPHRQPAQYWTHEGTLYGSAPTP